ncbi:hypothetical protein FRC07_005718 [Ceratobasidium sp. 392]|nr:hypothetical protein FRC07_005718 [Ceratobasidium sp. 392]
MAYGSTARQVLKVPELLGIICKYSDCRRSPGFLRVSRAFFRAVAPLVWEEVAGAHHVLKLLPGVSTETEGDLLYGLARRQGAVEISIVVLSDIEEATEFTRFDLYAPFVKRLNTLSSGTTGYRISDWRRLSELVMRRVLLPNLLELTVSPSSSSNRNIFLWIRTFLSPSLTSIVVEADPDRNIPTVPPLIAKSLLRHIQAACHKLQHFQFFPDLAQDYDANWQLSEYAIADFWEPSFFGRLGGLQLRKLGCTTELLSPKWIHILSEFLRLEGLDLYMTRAEIAKPQTISLPCLKHLGIHRAHRDGVQQVSKLGLLSGLTSLMISFYEVVTLQEDGWEKNIALLISRNCSELLKLQLEFDDRCDCTPNMSSFQPLAALSLTEVRLKGAIYTDDDDWKGLTAIWPIGVTQFEMWDSETVLEPTELCRFTKFPKLQRLALNVSWDSKIPHSVESVVPSYNLQIFEVTSESLYAEFDVSSAARYLLSLWPNLRLVRWSAMGEKRFSPTATESNTMVKALNEMVTCQRRMNRLKSRIIEEYGLGALDKLLDYVD